MSGAVLPSCLEQADKKILPANSKAINFFIKIPLCKSALIGRELVGLTEKNISVRLTRIREKMKQYLIEREVSV